MEAIEQPEPSLDRRRASPEAHAAGVRAMFDRIAPRYDLLNRLVSGGLDQRWRRRAVAELERAPRGPRLDLCAGTLDFAALLAEAFPDERVVAVDLAEQMMRAGRDKAPRVETVAADATALPFEAGTFAAATCGFGARNVASLDAFAREAFRVLAPGGMLVVLEAFRPERALPAFLHRAYMGRVFPALGAVISRDRAAYEYFVASVGAFVTRRDFERLLQNTGFRAVRGWDTTLGMAGVVVATKS
ncbi:MAG TPA: ubiquinone/menaquinone biosynthesis methyltransferase [Polyangiaceae bacterium]